MGSAICCGFGSGGDTSAEVLTPEEREERRLKGFYPLSLPISICIPSNE